MKKSLFIILALVLFICGCSTVSLFYRNADWYLQHKIAGYTSFDTRQKETIRREISDYMRWHRKYALPEYIIFLQNLNGAVQYDGQLKTGEVALLRARLMDLYRRSLVPAIRPVAQILSSLDNRQIQELGRNLAEENSKQKQEELDLDHDEYLDKRADKTVDFLEGLAGDLSDEQEHNVREMSRHLPLASRHFIRHRETNQARLIKLLNENAGTDRVASFMSSWILDPDATRTVQQQQDIQAFETASDEMIARIQWMLTVTQKEHMHKKISSYIDELQHLTTDMKTASGTSR